MSEMIETKDILSLVVSGTASVTYADQMPTEFIVSLTTPLPQNPDGTGKPIQIVLELEPYAEIASTVTDAELETGSICEPQPNGFYSYVARFLSVKARVKPEYTPYEEAEEAALRDVITSKKTWEKESSSFTRFTGMEI